MSQHTPGPWSMMLQNSRPKEYGGGITFWEVPVQVGRGKNAGNVLALVCMGGPAATQSTKESVEANARLIAAAPDLLEALRAYHYLPTVSVNGADLDGCRREAERLAEAAIAKATGGAT
jgi:hypothetical protein